MVLLCQTDTRLKFFVRARIPSAVWVSAQSQDVFITACIANEKWLAAELSRMHMFYMAAMAPRREFNQSFSMDACVVNHGGSAQRLNSAFFIYIYTHMHSIANSEVLCAEALLSLYSNMHGLRSQNGSVPSPCSL